MDIRQFRADLAQAFEAAGFDRRPIKRSKSSIWVLPGLEVERAFWEDAQRRPWGFLLSGVLSIDVPAFREWLTKKFPEDQHGILRSNLVGRHIANERDMFFGVELGERPPYEEWVGLIRTHLAALPDTIEGLLAAEQQPARLKMVWDKWDGPDAFRYLEAWASGDEPNFPPPHRSPIGQHAANDAL